ncbi:APC family permease [Galactobacter caseinivorans]|uniref:APC family permease n=1 Tax=Galactobacter caseinivorans TaxID=2676123 RepID=A0A496PFQ3_9MICC|nr:APC family permease [Galactobacter caseinivorans]RKW69456.1 APC family permease [Galactobacter caseinivorans]
MCLSGLDYFSTLGYQPAIAALAAGAVAPLATVVLILITVFGALPVYRKVAKASPNGMGSIAMLEKLLPRWWGKLLVLVLLGFAATDFMITTTLSTADATAHIVENPLVPDVFDEHRVAITLVLILGLVLLFLAGFDEVINLAVVLVAVFLALNAVVIVVALSHIGANLHLVDNWWTALTTAHPDPLSILIIALVVFPKLALGLSGFETGVAVMPQIKSGPQDTKANPIGRIVGARKLLTTAAIIMSTFLLTSSLATTVLIPAAEFEEGGKANGRALAYVAHELLGEGFGTVYDLATILVLWFAGASALAGMLNLIPRYLPRYGMAPQWAAATKPLVLFLGVIAAIITVIFEADVTAQGGAYATGVLVLITSAALAVTLQQHRTGHRRSAIGFGVITLVFVYTLITNCIERPDGLKVGGVFILCIIAVSFASRFKRSTEVRATSVTLSDEAMAMIRASAGRDKQLRLVAHEPVRMTAARYKHKLAHALESNSFPGGCTPLFLEVNVRDASEFTGDLLVTAAQRHGFGILEVSASSVPSAIAAVLLAIRDQGGVMSHVYFRWTEGSPVTNFVRFVFLGQGEIAPVTREVLREAEPDLTRRPWVHVS